VTSRLTLVLSTLIALVVIPTFAASSSLTVPKTVEAGNRFSISSSGSGQATLYIIGLGQVLKKEVPLGSVTEFPAGTLYNAGQYLVVLAGSESADGAEFDVVPSSKLADLRFIAKPSRLPVDQPDAITGTVYLFDAYQNLVTSPAQLRFELTSPSGALETRVVDSLNGAASVRMDSTSKQGAARFVAQVDGLSATRIVGQVPGDPCGLTMSASHLAQQVELQTEPVRDCKGNDVPDGTIITFTESYNGTQSTVDVPLKHGVAKVALRAHAGATISVASGVVLGNQIRLEK